MMNKKMSAKKNFRKDEISKFRSHSVIMVCKMAKQSRHSNLLNVGFRNIKKI